MQEKQIKKQLQELRRDMIFVKGGSFMMGSKKYDSESIHEVKVNSFHLCKYPVTQQLWEAVMGENPSYFKGKSRPVETISWDDTQAFIEKLNQFAKKYDHDLAYRLPSEAEWEYAARGGIYKDHHAFEYAGGNRMEELGWFDRNSNNETKTVGQKLPNALGLYDMSGHVWEWCADVWHEDYGNGPKDGEAWLEGGDQYRRVVRGGSWDDDLDNCRVSIRDWSFHVNRYYLFGCRLLGTLSVK